MRHAEVSLVVVVDRLLRAVLGFPIYVLSIILGEPVEDFERSRWATLIRIVEFVVAAVAAFIGGRQLGWW